MFKVFEVRACAAHTQAGAVKDRLHRASEDNLHGNSSESWKKRRVPNNRIHVRVRVRVRVRVHIRVCEREGERASLSQTVAGKAESASALQPGRFRSTNQMPTPPVHASVSVQKHEV